jgi:GNAT superfamily N-acetyltransferase
LKIRPANPGDLSFLEVMLFEAFFWNPASARPELAAFRRSNPEFVKLLSGWGRRGDWAAIAEDNDRQVGAAWFRLWTPDLHSYGYVDSQTPEVAIAVSKRDRRKGVGRALLDALIEQARADGFSALSLSVDPANPSRVLYEAMGFRRVGTSGTSWTLRLRLRDGMSGAV